MFILIEHPFFLKQKRMCIDLVPVLFCIGLDMLQLSDWEMDMAMLSLQDGMFRLALCFRLESWRVMEPPIQPFPLMDNYLLGNNNATGSSSRNPPS
mmetsp:Transcript_21455/g.38798  ORF Transcript_21455/g.38798 Transcript_21455/m.38798 type:complete len:96 (+) Transcript_21455:1227-1514(+)